MTKEREALEFIASQSFEGSDDGTIAIMAEFAVYLAKKALAQPEQEPTYKVTVVDDQHPSGIPLKQWVGLTGDDMDNITNTALGKSHAMWLTEAKLKELNHDQRT